MSSFPIFLYHALYPDFDLKKDRDVFWARDPQLRDPGARRYSLAQDAFLRQMTFLAETPRSVVTDWDQFCREGPAERFALTFDDGHVSNFTIALPVLEQFGFRGVFFITTDWIDRPGFLSQSQIRQLAEAGMLIGSHGLTHTFFSKLSDRQLKVELSRSRECLEAIVQRPVSGVSLPGGRSHERIRDLARAAGYRFCFTSTCALASQASDPMDLPRIPVTRDLGEPVFRDLARARPTTVAALARRARRRELLRRLMGDRPYRIVRSAVLRIQACVSRICSGTRP